MNFAEKCQALNQNGLCKADCCGPTPMSRDFIVEHYLSIPVELKYTLSAIPQSDYVLPMVDDDRCLFLDRTTCSCKIYDDRPEICRKFGDETHLMLSCPHMDAAGEDRNRQQRRKLQRNRDKAMDSWVKRIKQGGR